MKALQRTEHRFLTGDCREQLRLLPNASVHCCVTSPPYWGLRSYLNDDDPSKPLELGTEATPEEYTASLVGVFREVRRVLRADGTLWLNLGDSYAKRSPGGSVPPGCKDKDLVGLPWTVAFALRADGWWLRAENIWSKPSSLPENVNDRTTRTHEQVFMLAKSKSYFYDTDAIREPMTTRVQRRLTAPTADASLPAHRQPKLSYRYDGVPPGNPAGRNKRSVWTLNPEHFSGDHPATMPTSLAGLCILAGTSQHGCCPSCAAPWKRRNSSWHAGCKCAPADPVPCTVLDPFAGAGTTALASFQLGRASVSIELKAEYVRMAEQRVLTGSSTVKEAPAVDWFTKLCSRQENAE